MDSATLEREDRKYSLLWRDGYADADWRKLASYGMKMVPAGLNTLIDFGCGSGSAMEFFASSGFRVEGVDISSYAVQQQKGLRKVHHASLDRLNMLSEDQFEIGFCNDVLEHVPEDLVVPSLDEMVRVTSRYLLVSVCPKPSIRLSQDGENLHLTVKPKSWWKGLFRVYGDVDTVGWWSRSGRYVIHLRKP